MEQTIIKDIKLTVDGSLSITIGIERSSDWDETVVLTVGQISAIASLLSK